MADQSPAPELTMADAVVTFDIIEGNILDNGSNLFENLTEDEKQEVENVVTLLESAKEDSLKEFEPGSNAARHNTVDSSELDRLAGKNNSQSTNYQTKWAISVIKGKICSLLSKK